jgi:DNA-binding protein HU-beta
MRKSALLRSVAADTGVPYSTVKRVVDVMLDHVIERLHEGDRVVLSGFGTFALRPYKARTWVNPQTNRPVDIPAALRPGFVSSAALKRQLGTLPGPVAAGTADAHVSRRRTRAAASMSGPSTTDGVGNAVTTVRARRSRTRSTP